VIAQWMKSLLGRLRTARPSAGDAVAQCEDPDETRILHEEVRQLREAIDQSRRAIKNLNKRIKDLKAGVDLRVEKLELLTEHPEVAARTSERLPFPSPAVSVVMPSWNRDDVIGAAIRSVQAQTFPDWELLIVDDGSTDQTKQVVQTFAADRRISYARQNHFGQSAARNHALRLAKGSLIAYLDSDNIWYPEFLSAAVAKFSADPAVDCAYGAMVRDWKPNRPRILFQRFDRDRLLSGNFIGMSTFIHRRSLIERYGTFDETLDALEDWDLILRYTVHAPAHRLSVRAVRYRVMDDKRVSQIRHLARARTMIESKWASD